MPGLGNPFRDYFHEVSRGVFASTRTANAKYGRIAATTGGAFDTVWPGGTLTYLTAASTIRVKAGGNAADDDEGTGAQSVTITGLDANYNEITDTLATNGTSASTASTNSYLRVLRAFVTTVGSGAVNAGDITLEAVTGGTTQAFIAAGEGQTQQCFFTVPANTTAYIVGKEFSVNDQEGAGTTQHLAHIRIRIRLYNEASNNNYESWRTLYDTGLDTDGNCNLAAPEVLQVTLPEKTDVAVEVFTHAANAEVNARLFTIEYQGNR